MNVSTDLVQAARSSRIRKEPTFRRLVHETESLFAKAAHGLRFAESAFPETSVKKVVNRQICPPFWV